MAKQKPESDPVKLCQEMGAHIDAAIQVATSSPKAMDFPEVAQALNRCQSARTSLDRLLGDAPQPEEGEPVLVSESEAGGDE